MKNVLVFKKTDFSKIESEFQNVSFKKHSTYSCEEIFLFIFNNSNTKNVIF